MPRGHSPGNKDMQEGQVCLLSMLAFLAILHKTDSDLLGSNG